MNQPEFTTIHCGKLVSIQLEKSKDANITNIQAHVYEYTGQIFNKLRVIQSKVKGSWNILCVDKAICNKTGVVQVCVLLQNTKSSRYLNLLTLQHLRTFQTFFTYKHIETLSAVRPCNIHIAHGPSVVLYNPTVNCILYFYLTENKQTKIASAAAPNVRFMVSQSFDKIQAQFDFLAFKNPEKSSTDLKLVNQEKEILVKENDSGWFKLSFVREFSGETRILEEKSNLIPDINCSVITAYFQMENKGEVLYMTNKQQLVLSRNGSIIKSCAIPFSSCKEIYVVGSDDRAIVVTHDLNNSACCLVRLSTFQILETWTNISAVAYGPLPILNSVQMCVVMLKMPSGLEQSSRNSHDQPLGVALEPMKFSPCGSDEEDLFASSPLSDQHPDLEERRKNGLNIVMEVLHKAARSQRLGLEDMRKHLDQESRVISNYSSAIRAMNCNMNMPDEKTQQTESTDEELVDLFSGLPSAVHHVEPVKPMFSILGDVWQRTFDDQWIVGVSLRNISQNSYFQVGIIISPCDGCMKEQESKFDLEPSYATDTTWTLVNNNSEDYDLLKTHKNESTQVNPGQEFVATAITKIPNFENFLQVDFVVTLIAFRLHDGDSTDSCFLRLAKLAIPISDVACGSLEIKPADFITHSLDSKKSEFHSLRALNTVKSVLVISSAGKNIYSLLKDILESKLGLKRAQGADWLIGATPGPFYLTQVVLRLKLREEVEIHVHSRSISTASLLKVWIMKNIPDCTAVLDVAKTPGLENCLKNDKLNFSNFQPVVAAERRSDNIDCFIVDNQSALNYKDDFVDLLLNQCSNV